MCDKVTNVDRVEVMFRVLCAFVHSQGFEGPGCCSIEVVSSLPFHSASLHTPLVTSRGCKDGTVADVISVTFYWQGAAKKWVLV